MESDNPEPARSPDVTGVRGPRIVGVLYVLLVAFAGVAGVLFARTVEGARRPALLFVIELPATEVGFAVYGAVTVAIVLGVPLAAVVAVSQRADLDRVEG
jgi:hypothetical protein